MLVVKFGAARIENGKQASLYELEENYCIAQALRAVQAIIEILEQ